jgi:hypothetical protein
MFPNGATCVPVDCFSCASITKIQLRVFVVYHKTDIIIMSSTSNFFSSWYSWKLAHLPLNNSLPPSLTHSLTHWNICVTNDHGYVPLVIITSRSFPHSWLITGSVTRLKRWVQLAEQELITLPEHLSSPPAFSGVRVTRSLVLYVCFVDRCLSFCTFSFGHCVVCSSLIYGFWLPLWYLQTLLIWYIYYSNLQFLCNVIRYHPSGICDLSRICLSSLGLLVYLLPKL